MGKTVVNENSFALKENNISDGACQGNVAGTYIHGIFDSQDVAEKLLRKLFQQKGLVFQGKSVDRKAYKETQYNLLADKVRQSMDMNRIYQIIGEGTG